MSQHDHVIDSASGAAVRADLNNALLAIVSQNSGSSAPSTTYAYMRWPDTTNGVIKRRNAANSGWLVERTLDETIVLSRSSNTVLGLSDIGKVVIATSTFTQTLAAAATLTGAWWIDYRNDGSGIITIDPDASEQIDGATTIKLYPGESCRIFCTGSAFKTTGRSTGQVLIQQQSASGSSSIDFTTGIDSGFDEYVIQFDGVLPATNAVSLQLQVSQDAGSSWKTSAGNYQWVRAGAYSGSTSATLQNSAADTSISIVDGVLDNTSTRPAAGEIRFYAPSAAKITNFEARSTFYSANLAGTYIGQFNNSGAYVADTNAINGVRLKMSSGNISGGNFRLYGVRKS